MRTKAGLLFLLISIFISCQKKTLTQASTSTTIAQNVPDTLAVPPAPDEEYVQESTFDIQGAEVFDKAGREDEVAELLDHLHYFNLLSQKDYSEYYNQNQNKTLKSNFDIVENLRGAQIINADSLSGQFPGFYKDLIFKIAKNEKLNISNYNVKDTVINDENFEEHIAKISFTCDGKKYVQTVSNNEDQGKLDENFYKALNSCLAAKRDTGRLYLFKKIMVFKKDSNQFYGTDNKEFALVKLQEGEAFAIHQYPNVTDLSYEEHRLPKNTAEVLYMIKRLDSSGFLSNVNDRNMFESNLNNALIYDLNDIFYQSPSLRMCIAPSLKMTKPYESVLKNLSAFSNGHFNPENISDPSGVNSLSEVSYTLNNKKYTASFQNGIDKIDLAGLMQLVNFSLNDQKVDGNFYLLDNPESESCYIFMDEQQMNVANDLATTK